MVLILKDYLLHHFILMLRLCKLKFVSEVDAVDCIDYLRLCPPGDPTCSSCRLAVSPQWTLPSTLSLVLIENNLTAILLRVDLG